MLRCGGGFVLGGDGKTFGDGELELILVNWDLLALISIPNFDLAITSHETKVLRGLTGGVLPSLE